MLAASLLLAACGRESAGEHHTYLLEGAWTLHHVSTPYGTERHYTVTGNGTYCIVYAGDTAYYECMLSTIPSGQIVKPTVLGSVMLIDNGHERLYLEDGDPHPLTLSGDSLLTIQRDGVKYSYIRADNIYTEWGHDLRYIISSELGAGSEGSPNSYVLSARERRQQQQIQWLGAITAVVVLMVLMAFYLAIINRRAKQRLQLQLQQIEEVKQNRPQPVCQAIASLEHAYFASDDHAALLQRMSSGSRLKVFK